MPVCGSTTLCKWRTVNEALDLILDRGPTEDENIEPEEVVEEEEMLNMIQIIKNQQLKRHLPTGLVQPKNDRKLFS